MTSDSWNAWKLTTMGLVLSIVVAFVTGLVVANWNCREARRRGLGGHTRSAACGTLYGLNENRRSDEQYREAYARCMRASGYTG